MKKLLLFSVLAYSTISIGQETLFSDNFESGAANWQLNAGTGSNNWILNNVYLGSSGLIPDTPSQPAGVFNAPNSNYMHIYNATYGPLLNAYNASFLADDPSNRDLIQVQNISTVGASDVTISYWYLCGGDPGSAEGKVYYSTNNGTNWTLLATHHSQTTWTQATYTLPAFENQATLKFKFNWTNGNSGSDPAFAIDDVLITGTLGSIVTTAISNVSVPPSSAWCYGTTAMLDVSFTAQGTFNSGNIFNAELSDATGDFTNPTIIGSLSSTATGSHTINASISNTMAAGTNYRVRVTSSNEAAISADNGSNIVIYELPTVSFAQLGTTCVYDEPISLTTATPTGGTYSGTGVSAGEFSNATAGIGTHQIIYTYVDNNGCLNSDTASIIVDACVSIKEVQSNQFSIYPNPAADYLHISGDGITSVVIVDLLGNEVKLFSTAQTTYDVSNLKNGTYLVKVSSQNASKTFKVLIR